MSPKDSPTSSRPNKAERSAERPSTREVAGVSDKRRRTQAAEISADLLQSNAEDKEKKEKFEILVDGREVVNEFGYKMKVFIPKGCDGGVDLYFPGGGSGIEVPLKRDRLKEKWMEAGKKGKRRALVIVEGKVKPTWRGHKYSYLSVPNALPSILRTIQNTAEGLHITNVHAIGHSMGGQALHFLASRPGVTGLTYLDATYWPAEPVIDLARRGGRVNIVFRPGTRTESSARKLISALKLKKTAPDKWEGLGGRVRVFATKKSHTSLVNPYVGMFLGASSVPVRTFSPFLDRYSHGYGGMSVENLRKMEKSHPAGVLHNAYLKAVKAISSKVAAGDVTTLRKSSIEDIRYNSHILTTGKPDTVTVVKSETQRRVRAYTSSYDGKWYALDYAKMGSDAKGRSHEDYIGLGDVFIDPNITSLLIDRGGEMILAKRGIVKSGKHKGRVGFLDKDGNYVATHTGDRVRILTNRVFAEKTFIDKYKAEEGQRNKRPTVFAEDEGHPSRPALSSYARGSGGHFYRKNGPRWAATPEAHTVDDRVEITSREPFVSGRDSFGNRVILRRSAMKAFYRARHLAETGNYSSPPGPKVRLRVSSSYRSFAHQRRLNPGGKGSRWVAAPGKSWHHSGGAMDIIAYVFNPKTGKWEGGGWHANQKYLKKILPLASWVNYKHEPWHWEYGTKRWQAKLGKSGSLYAKVRVARVSGVYRGVESSLA